MAVGFSAAHNFDPIIGWELYQVTIDKYHIMFWFNDGRDLLNVANKFSYSSADDAVNFVYDIYGPEKLIAIDRILRQAILSWKIASKNELIITFENGDQLSVLDNPKIRSWWFISEAKTYGEMPNDSFCLSDSEYDDLTQAQIDERSRDI